MKSGRHNWALSLLWIGLLGCAGTSCKRYASPVKPSSSAAVIATAKPIAAPIIPAPPNLVALLRSRKFDEAVKVIEALPNAERRRPSIRLALAFAWLRSFAPERVKPELTGVAEQSPILARDVTKVIAEAEQAMNALGASRDRKSVV